MDITTPTEGAALLERLRLTCAYTRSIQVETSGETVTRQLSPYLFEDSLLQGALQRLEGKTPTWGTLGNILYLVGREPLLVLGYGLQWGEDLPDRYTIPPYHGGDM